MYANLIQCVKYMPNLHAQNWILYVLISFGPLTIFLLLVVCLRINAALAPLNAFVFISQVITQPPFASGFINTINNSFLPNSAKTFMRFLCSLYGIWNLDFFVAMILSLCLPHQNVFSVITLIHIQLLFTLQSSWLMCCISLLSFTQEISESYCGYGSHFIRATFNLGDTVTSELLSLMFLQLFLNFYFRM